MPNKNKKETISATIDKLFEIAKAKMKDDDSKAVVDGLRKLLSQVEEDMYYPKPRYVDAFFFPDEKNIQKLVGYL